MKKATKYAVGALLLAVVSAGIGGITACSLVKGNTNDEGTKTFEQMFKTAPMNTAGLDVAAFSPVDLTTAAETSLNSVVHITAIQHSKTQTVQSQPDFFDFFFGDGRGRQQQVQTPEQKGWGSGVIISTDGYIVTNNHVIDGADEISVKLHDGRELKGRIIGADSDTDLALVKIEGDDFPAIKVGDSDALKVGEWVLAVGNPFNLGSTVTAGVVSAKSRGLGANPVESFIQTDAAINQGNSGGALVNAKGELIGINAMLYSRTGSYAGYGFAIPTSIMSKVVTDLKQYGTVQRALLGIAGRDMGNELYDDKIKEEQGKLGINDGVQVVEVSEGGSSEGILKKDDVIIAVNGNKIKSMAELQGTLAKFRPGDRIKVKVWRDKSEKEFDITLKNAQGNTGVVKGVDMDLLGAAFRELPADMKRQLNLGYGLQVTGVSDGRMKDSGIQKGFIILKANGKQLRQVSDLEAVMKEASQSPDQVLFMTGVYPSGKRANYAVDLSQN